MQPLAFLNLAASRQPSRQAVEGVDHQRADAEAEDERQPLPNRQLGDAGLRPAGKVQHPAGRHDHAYPHRRCHIGIVVRECPVPAEQPVGFIQLVPWPRLVRQFAHLSVEFGHAIDRGGGYQILSRPRPAFHQLDLDSGVRQPPSFGRRSLHPGAVGDLVKWRNFDAIEYLLQLDGAIWRHDVVQNRRDLRQVHELHRFQP